MQQAHVRTEDMIKRKRQKHRVATAERAATLHRNELRRSVLRSLLEEMDKYFLAGAKSKDLCITMQSELAEEILGVTDPVKVELLFGVELTVSDKFRALFGVMLKKERVLYERLATQ